MGCKQNFQKNLQYLVNHAGYDRIGFCKKLDVSYTTFSEWWTGRHLPNDRLIDKIADELHVSTSVLFEDEVVVTTTFTEKGAYASLLIDKKPYMMNLLKAADRMPMDKVLFITELLDGYKE